MAEMIPMLALSPTMEQGVIVKWVKKEGDKVDQGDVICEVETDKATMEYESPADGILLKIVQDEGKSVEIGQCIAIIGSEGEDISGLLEETAKEPGRESDVEQKEPEKTAYEPAQPKPEVTTIRSSPLARKLAKDNGIALSSIKGSGPGGRITETDVKHAIEQKATPVIKAGINDETIAVSPKRKKIAQVLSDSKFSAPHYYVSLTAFAETIVKARQLLNKKTENNKISFNSFMIKLVAEVLAKHPIINSSWAGNSIIKHNSIDIALAVSQADGLITPIVRNCRDKGIVQIDKELKALVEKAKLGTLSLAEYTDSTFTISNLGSFGIEDFTAIINPPNSAILAVGKIQKSPVVDDNDNIQIRQTMKMTLSCDHRIIDGTIAADFLCDLKEIIECPIEGLY